MDTESDTPSLERKAMRTVFWFDLLTLAEKEGFDVVRNHTSEGLLVAYRKQTHVDFSWGECLIHWNEMTEDKIKELIVRWKMGL